MAVEGEVWETLEVGVGFGSARKEEKVSDLMWLIAAAKGEVWDRVGVEVGFGNGQKEEVVSELM